MQATFKEFLIRDWQPSDRQPTGRLIQTVLAEYGLGFEPDAADQDAMQVEDAYWSVGGEFWVVEQQQILVGTAAYYPIARGNHAVEIRKMYLHPDARGQGLGRHLLELLEQAIAHNGYHEIWLETASILKEAVKLYESSGYQPITDVETPRCDRAYKKALTISDAV